MTSINGSSIAFRGKYNCDIQLTDKQIRKMDDSEQKNMVNSLKTIEEIAKTRFPKNDKINCTVSSASIWGNSIDIDYIASEKSKKLDAENEKGSFSTFYHPQKSTRKWLESIADDMDAVKEGKTRPKRLAKLFEKDNTDNFIREAAITDKQMRKLSKDEQKYIVKDFNTAEKMASKKLLKGDKVKCSLIPSDMGGSSFKVDFTPSKKHKELDVDDQQRTFWVNDICSNSGEIKEFFKDIADDIKKAEKPSSILDDYLTSGDTEDKKSRFKSLKNIFGK